MDGVVGADQEIGPNLRELARGEEHQLPDLLPVAAIDAVHIFGERESVQRDLGMGVRSEKLCTLGTDGPVAQRCAFSGTADDPDVEGRDANILGYGSSVNAHISLSFLTTCAVDRMVDVLRYSGTVLHCDISDAKPGHETQPFVEGVHAGIRSTALHQHVVAVSRPGMPQCGLHHGLAMTSAA